MMQGADIWVLYDNATLGELQVIDTRSEAFKAPKVDESQDVQLVSPLPPGAPSTCFVPCGLNVQYKFRMNTCFLLAHDDHPQASVEFRSLFKTFESNSIPGSIHACLQVSPPLLVRFRSSRYLVVSELLSRGQLRHVTHRMCQ